MKMNIPWMVMNIHDEIVFYIFCENQNQLELHNGFKKEKISINVGLIKNLKKFDNIILNYINNPKKLIFLSQQSKKKVDFNGPNRILNYIRQKY